MAYGVGGGPGHMWTSFLLYVFSECSVLQWPTTTWGTFEVEFSLSPISVMSENRDPFYLQQLSYHLLASVLSAGITSDSHFEIYRNWICWTERQSGSPLLYIFFPFWSVPTLCDSCFPLCSASSLFNDHFEAVSLSCVMLQSCGRCF